MQVIEKHSDLLTWASVEDLRTPRQGPCVSIFMPTHRTWVEAGQDSVQLQNLLREAEEKLVQAGLRPTEARDLLAPAAELVANDVFWQYQSDGLAVFLAPSDFAVYRLPLAFFGHVAVGNHYFLQPLLRFFADDSRYFVLVLAWDGARLFQGARTMFREVNPDQVPHPLAALLQRGVQESQRQVEEGPSSTVLHRPPGILDPAYARGRLKPFFFELDQGINALLAADAAPLILAGPAVLRDLYREVNRYEHLAVEGVEADSAAGHGEAVQQRAWAITERHIHQLHQERLDRYRGLADVAPERVTCTLDDTIPAAYQRRIDTLFVEAGRHVWGRFEQAFEDVTVHTRAQPGDYDLLDVAVAYTLLYGGGVYTLESAEMPIDAPLAAILRY